MCTWNKLLYSIFLIKALLHWDCYIKPKETLHRNYYINYEALVHLYGGI